MSDTKKNIKLKKAFLIIALLAAGLILFLNADNSDVLYQASVLSGLSAGDYDGKISLAEIRSKGDFGIGTFDRLDGEALVLDGNFYQIRNDGKVLLAPWRLKTPFIMLTSFDPKIKFAASASADYQSLQQSIDQELPTKNIPYAIRIDGVFKYLKTRSVPAQKKPYPILTDAVKNQTIFEFSDIAGTLVGFRMPDFTNGVNIPGYHFHFLSHDKTKGGHVLDCAIASGEIKIDDISQIVIVLHRSKDFDEIDFSKFEDATAAAEHKN